MEGHIHTKRASAVISIIFVLTLASTELYAQSNDYRLISSEFIVFQPNSQFILPEGCYNCFDEQYLIGARVISAASYEDSEVYRFNTELRDKGAGCYKPGASIIGDSIIEELGGISQCFSSQGDTITFDRSLKLGESNKIFEFENGNYILALVVSHEPESFLEVTDSVKTFSLQLFDVDNNPIEGLINTQVIKISKSYGLVRFFNVRDFPFTEFAVVDLELETNSLLDFSHVFLTYGEVYNFDIGDEFHYLSINTAFGPDGYMEFSRTVLEKEEFLEYDSVRYTYEERGIGWQIKYVDNTVKYESFEIDTTYESTYTDLSEFVVAPDIMPFEAILINENTLGNVLIIKNEDKYNGRYSTRLFGSELYIDNDCAYPPHDSHSVRFTYFIEGCGELVNDITAEIREECYPCESLLYFKKGDESWGEPLGSPETKIDDSHISIYPNPAEDRIRFQSRDEISQIRIFNALGTQLYFADGLDNMFFQVDISEFESGLYLIEIRTVAGQIEVKKVVIE